MLKPNPLQILCELEITRFSNNSMPRDCCLKIYNKKKIDKRQDNKKKITFNLTILNFSSIKKLKLEHNKKGLLEKKKQKMHTLTFKFIVVFLSLCVCQSSEIFYGIKTLSPCKAELDTGELIDLCKFMHRIADSEVNLSNHTYLSYFIILKRLQTTRPRRERPSTVCFHSNTIHVRALIAWGSLQLYVRKTI